MRATFHLESVSVTKLSARHLSHPDTAFTHMWSLVVVGSWRGGVSGAWAGVVADSEMFVVTLISSPKGKKRAGFV